jgi:hypothetical protein
MINSNKMSVLLLPGPVRSLLRAAGVIALAVAPAFANMIITPNYNGTAPVLSICPCTPIASDATNGATIESTINSAIAVYESTLADPIDVHISFFEISSGLGASDSFFNTISYSAYRTALAADAKDANDITAVSTLPVQAANPVNGNLDVNVTTANLRALGLSGAAPVDGNVFLNTSIMNLSRTGSPDSNKYDLMAVVSHEIDEVLGFGSALNGSSNGDAAPTGPVSPEDLFRYSAPNTRGFDTGANSTAYFSIDSGTTNLAGFNQTQGGDFSDWDGASLRVQNAFGTPGAQPNLGIELTALDIIGYDLVVPEPGTMVLLGAGLAMAVVVKRRRRISNLRQAA